MSQKSIFYFFILLQNIPVLTFAQTLFQYDHSIPVLVKEKPLQLAWSGGLNAGQYQTMDLNGDEKEDLVVFDRSSGEINTFLAIDQKYVADQSYALLFPREIRSWMVIADYNCDGKKDIFTYTDRGIKVFQNITETGSPLNFQLSSEFLQTHTGSQLTNLKINSSDIPAIVDLDEDGDLDIINFRASGTSLEYHQNMSMEASSNCGIENFQQVTKEWGGIIECGCGHFAFNGANCEENNIRPSHVGGKSLLVFDRDKDGDFDIIIGEEDCAKLSYLENKGTAENLYFDEASSKFPNSETAVHLESFPAAFLADVDFDGIKDLLVAPNLSGSNGKEINWQNSSWLYRNTNADPKMDFSFVKDNFLQDEMLDFGETAAPTFYDLDNDGDQDLLVCAQGNHFDNNQYSTVWYFENTGSLEEAVFEFRTTDFAGLSALRLQNLFIQFANLSNHVGEELIVSGQESNLGTSKAFYFNRKSADIDGFSNSTPNAIDITFLSGDQPYFYDINRDGLIDLLLARRSGRLEFLQNIGNEFVLQEENFLGISDGASRVHLHIHIGDINNDGLDDLITTNVGRQLKIFESFLNLSQEELIEPVLENILNPLNGQTISASFGKMSYMTTADLNNDGYDDFMLGSSQGGLFFLRNLGETDLNTSNLSFNIYPNPGGDFIRIKAKNLSSLEVFSYTGQKLLTFKTENPNKVVLLDTQNFRSGVYIVKANFQDKESISQKFIIQK
ncbi:T9SS type A sorting domain-containing protein [Xanthovirga aplysinae]|uniref:T9SS type A sorting domain-containing protein n=1 Tax=Xanthovirga aplysinae TaxID=2529853 RepID=UPI0012BB8E71|nr:T9SS type A sorting domain-containing protein [Xanthovirga aplysinae]MTI31642.1 T9SS type A sorting domain-containing protein [Xanthovirga aplysinae]